MAFKFVVFAAFLALANAGVLQPLTYAQVANPAVDAVASTHQNVVRSFDGTVSQYSKAVETPYSSVRKEDTRISNNVYTPAIAKTVFTHAEPAVHQTLVGAPAQSVYAHHEAGPAVYEHHEAAPAAVYAHHEVAPTVYTHVAPSAAKTVRYAAPAVVKPVTYSVSAAAKPAAYVAPAVAKTVSYAAPAVSKTVTYASPVPVHHVYQHEAPVATTTYSHGPAAATYTHNAPGVAAYGSSQTVHYSPAEMVSHMSFEGFGTHWGF